MKYDVVSIGNPLLDLTFEVEDKFLEEASFNKGRMHLITEKDSETILNKLENYKRFISPGGSAANVSAGVSVLGGKAFFIGSVGEEPNGYKYETLSRDTGVETSLAKKDLPTGFSIALITPDYERTLITFLGSALLLKKEDIYERAILDTKILHIEGFQFENPGQTEASIHAMKIAKKNGTKISIDLADSAFIERHFETLRDIVDNYADIVFANLREAEAFTGEKDPMNALNKLSEVCEIAVVTMGVEGSLIKKGDELHKIPAFKVKEVNTNGAGDMYDAGVLYGIANEMSLEDAGKIASYGAAKAVESHGARVESVLKQEIDRILSKDF